MATPAVPGPQRPASQVYSPTVHLYNPPPVMGRMRMQRAQHVVESESRPELRVVPRRSRHATNRPTTVREIPRPAGPHEAVRHPARKRRKTSAVFWRRRLAALGMLGLCVFLALLVGLGTGEGHSRPIAPAKAGPGTVLASADGIHLTTPIRPAQITGLGYHPAGGDLIGLDPRGRNLSTSPMISLLSGGYDRARIGYFLMAPAGRPGSETGALDVGARAGTAVYAPVSGVVTSVQPDPLVEGASIIEIQPEKAPNERVSVALIGKIKNGVGVDSPVKAGKTRLGTVADSSSVLKTQLSSYVRGPGDHVTISAYYIG
jgi:hypothetical protein